MDAELAEFLAEQKRQEQMLRDMGLLDDEPAEAENEQAEALPLVLNKLDQEQHQAHQEQPKEETSSELPGLLPKLTPALIVTEAPRIALSIGAEGRGMAHVKPVPIRSASGRSFHDFTSRVYATDAHGWLASFAAFQKDTGNKPTGADLAALLPEAEDVAADLLDVAKAAGWERWTMTAAPEYFPILAAAFRKAIKSGLPLVPDFGQACQGDIFQHAAQELRRGGILDRAKAKAVAVEVLPIAEQEQAPQSREQKSQALREKVAALLRSNAAKLVK